MSFKIGENKNKYVTVSNVTMRFVSSEKVLFADLRTSRKTGRFKIDKQTGEAITTKDGTPVAERIYSHWEGRFVGNALEPAKELQNGQSINIVNGWIEKENTTGKDGKKYTNTIVVITDFVLSDFKSYDDSIEEIKVIHISDFPSNKLILVLLLLILCFLLPNLMMIVFR